MNRWIVVFSMFAVTASGYFRSTSADEVSVSVPEDTKYVVQIDIQAFRTTTLGSKLFEIAKSKVQEELSKASANKGPDLTKIKEMIGFDPLEELGSIVILGSNYDRPEQSIVISIRLGKTTGNLEGLILGLPGYAAEEYGQQTIYSAKPDDEHQIFGAFHTDRQGLKTILIAAQRDALIHQLDFLDGKSAGNASYKTIKLTTEGKSILSLEVFDIPTELIGEGPQSGVAKIVRGVSLRIAELKGKLDIALSLKAGSEKQAEQLRQMAQGLIAMIGFAQSMDPDDQDLKEVLKFMEGIKASQDGTSVKIGFSVPVEQLSKLIDKIDLD